MKACYVSLFYDIGRSDWNTYYSRKTDRYINSFIPFINMFSTNNDDYEMILFLDKRCEHQIRQLMTENTRITIIPIDEQFMKENFHAWGLLERETEIMESHYFKQLVSHRIDHPECCDPLYTIITHCKIDAVGYTISNNLTTAPYVAWVDFGYCLSSETTPTNFIDLNKLTLTSVNFPLINPIEDKDKDIIYTLTEAPERVAGYFFFGPVDKLLEYQREYHTSLHRFQNEFNIADDDQHLTLDCINRRPDLFTTHPFWKWHVALTHFSL